MTFDMLSVTGTNPTFLIEVLEHGGEASARGAPVSREVEEDQVLCEMEEVTSLQDYHYYKQASLVKAIAFKKSSSS